MNAKLYNAILPVIIAGISIFFGLGCRKFVEIELPVDKVTANAVFNNSGDASAALSNIYYMLVTNGLVGGAGSTSVKNGLTADELVLHNEGDMQLQSFYSNSISSRDFGNWGLYYNLVFRVNSIVEGVESSKGITDNAKNELIGQAKFLRAFFYFYLVNLYGGVPLVNSTDYKVNMLLPRSTEEAVYANIIKDLIDAQALVSENYLNPDLVSKAPDRGTANKLVVTAFLARVYLYTGQWKKAGDEATKVIDDPKYSILEALNDVFLMNSKEAIWQIEGDISRGQNSVDGNFFIPFASNIIPTVYLSNSLLTQISDDDQRRKNWIKNVEGSEMFYYPFKYKQRDVDQGVTKEYNMILRLAEQYLIRSEARAHLNDIDGAIADLNVIRKRAKISLYSSLNQETLLQAIEKERQIELFSEFGHRWFDLKRTGRLDAVMAPIKGSNWQPTDKLFPIPVDEFLKNPSLRGHQNPGYSEQ